MQAKLIYLIASNQLEAENIAKIIIEEKLAACVNIHQPIKSFYIWQNKLEISQEIALMIKTKASLEIKLIARIKRLHSHSIPCIISLDINGGNSDYLEWINKLT